MDMTEIRGLTDVQLAEELEDARREVFDLRFRAVTKQISNTNEPGVAKKKVARMMTVRRERQISNVEDKGDDNGS
jgi:large subunit ribosomal protein L29